MNATVAVVTDSSACIPEGLAAARGIRIVDLTVTIDGEPVRAEGAERRRIVAEALEGGRTILTSAPPPGRFLEAFTACAETGAEEIVSVHLSSRMSTTVNMASIAGRMAPVPIHVLDSRVVGMALGFATLAGAELAERGDGPEAVAATMSEVAAGCVTMFSLPSIDHLVRGGRLAAGPAAFANLFRVRPVLGLGDGAVVPIGVVRARTDTALGLVPGLVRRLARGSPIDLAVHHVADEAAAASHLDAFVRALGDAQVEVRARIISELDAGVSTHTGPGTLGVVAKPVGLRA